MIDVLKYLKDSYVLEGVALSGAKGGTGAHRQKWQEAGFGSIQGSTFQWSQLPKDGVTVPREGVLPVTEVTHTDNHSEGTCGGSGRDCSKPVFQVPANLNGITGLQTSP